MTTASISAPSLRGDTWLNQDCEQRLSTLEKLDSNESSTADFLLKVALEDDFEKVRSSAISRIVDLEALAKLGAAGGKAKEAAQQQSDECGLHFFSSLINGQSLTGSAHFL